MSGEGGGGGGALPSCAVMRAVMALSVVPSASPILWTSRAPASGRALAVGGGGREEVMRKSSACSSTAASVDRGGGGGGGGGVAMSGVDMSGLLGLPEAVPVELFFLLLPMGSQGVGVGGGGRGGRWASGGRGAEGSVDPIGRSDRENETRTTSSVRLLHSITCLSVCYPSRMSDAATRSQIWLPPTRTPPFTPPPSLPPLALLQRAPQRPSNTAHRAPPCSHALLSPLPTSSPSSSAPCPAPTSTEDGRHQALPIQSSPPPLCPAPTNTANTRHPKCSPPSSTDAGACSLFEPLQRHLLPALPTEMDATPLPVVPPVLPEHPHASFIFSLAKFVSTLVRAALAAISSKPPAHPPSPPPRADLPLLPHVRSVNPNPYPNHAYSTSSAKHSLSLAPSFALLRSPAGSSSS